MSADPYWEEVGRKVELKRAWMARERAREKGPRGVFVESGGHKGGDLVPTKGGERYWCDACQRYQLESKMAARRASRPKCRMCGRIVQRVKDSKAGTSKIKRKNCKQDGCKKKIPKNSTIPVCADCFNAMPYWRRSKMVLRDGQK